MNTPQEATSTANLLRDPTSDDPGFRRIVRAMQIIAGACAAVFLVVWGWRFGVGFGVGCAVAWINFLWLRRGINALAINATAAESQSGSKTSVKFLLRYALIAVVAYVIVKSSVVSPSGFFAGLFLPVPAILFEAIYETTVALRHDE